MRTIITAALSLSTAILITGCGEGSTSNTTTEPTVVNAAWLLDAEPAGAQSVSETKASAAEGDEVTIRARIGGRKEPLTTGSAVFTVVDLEVPHCVELKGDTCPTPWDYCCEPRESLTSNSATIQLVNADGSPIEGDASALEPLDEIIIVGAVGPRPDQNVLTIKASGVYRVKNGEQHRQRQHNTQTLDRSARGPARLALRHPRHQDPFRP